VSGDRPDPPSWESLVRPMLRMAAIAAAWFGVLGLVTVLTREPGLRDRAAPAMEDPFSTGTAPLPTRSLRHGGSGPVPAAAL